MVRRKVSVRSKRSAKLLIGSLRRKALSQTRPKLKGGSLTPQRAKSIKRPNVAKTLASSATKKENEPTGKTTEKRTVVLFENMPLLDSVKRAIKFKEATRTQAAVIPRVLKGDDLMVKAQTGSGKTLSFLVPIANLLLREGPVPRGDGAPIRALVLNPSKVLVSQSTDEARDLLTRAGPGFGALKVIGGTNMGQDRSSLRKDPVDVLLAAPGRLIDHIQNTPGFRQRLAGVRVLVLDEADQLLSNNFLGQVRTIMSALPSKKQTLLYSATLDEPAVLQQARALVSPGTEYLEVAAPALNLASEYVVLAPNRIVHVLHALLVARSAADPRFKAIVFFNNVSTVVFVAKLLELAGLKTLQLHSDVKNQERVRESFRIASSGILLASNLASFGMDFTDVTLVVQVGYTPPKDFIQRLGRTARAGKQGEALALLGTDERRLLEELKGLKLPAPLVESAQSSSIFPHSATSTNDPQFQMAINKVQNDSKVHKLAELAYKGSVGYYNSVKKALKWQDRDVVQNVHVRFHALGLQGFPKLSDKLNLRL